jgi:hypothetical protein
MADHKDRGLVLLLCEVCRRRSPMFVKGRYRWRCDHRGISIHEDAGIRRLIFDEPTSSAARRPRTINNEGPGPFFTRVVAV